MSLGYAQSLAVSTIQGRPALTARVQAFMNENLMFSWNKVAPVMPVDSERNFFYVIPFAFGRTVMPTKREMGGQAPSSKPTVQTATFTILEDVHKTPILQRELDIALKSPQGFKGLLKLIQANSGNIVSLALEQRTATMLQTNANYFNSGTQVSSLGTGDRWDESTSKPADDIIELARVIRGYSGFQLQDLVLAVPYEVHLALLSNPDVRAQYTPTSPTGVGAIDIEKIRQYFGVRAYEILGAQKITSNVDAATQTVANVWSDSVYLFTRDEGASQDAPTGGAWFTASTQGSVLPVFRAYKNDDPEGQYFEAQALSASVVGASSTDVGTRCAARLDDVLT